MDFNQNYFEIFGLPINFSVDLNLLGERYRGLLREVHPDNFVDGTDQERRLSMQWTTQVNTAYGQLKSPLNRAIYMLRISAVEIAANPVLPPGLLMRQIELRERLEEIEESDSGLDELADFRRSLGGEMLQLEAVFASAVDDDLTAAEQVVYELQFLNKLGISAEHLEEKLLDY